ncbi:MAG TPA: ADP-ribosylation factor-like protein [Candidatus Deferrimicrobium sp.]|nr:ADP-ribosylation factor-like protein [Candidatus Deferrimicrobium sp.]
MAQNRKISLKKKFVKILIMGLDNSGKSSILLSLTKTTNLLSYFSLKPTKGINIVKIEDQDTSFNIWDFGGQIEYRSRYLDNFDKYTSEIDQIIFVIDIQDIHRYGEALNYFEEILKLIPNKKEIQFAIFLHKFDPNIEVLDNYTEEKINANLVNKLEKLIPPEMTYKIFKTTIYTIFQKTLFR